MRIATLLRSSTVLAAAAGLLAVVATAPARAADMTGTFPVCFQSKAAPGAVSMALNLMVVAPDKTLSGDATMGQATHPPLDVKLPVKGSYVDIANGRTHAELESADMAGRHLAVSMTVGKGWKAAIAHYMLWMDTPTGTKTGKAVLRQVACTPAK